MCVSHTVAQTVVGPRQTQTSAFQRRPALKKEKNRPKKNTNTHKPKTPSVFAAVNVSTAKCQDVFLNRVCRYLARPYKIIEQFEEAGCYHQSPENL